MNRAEKIKEIGEIICPVCGYYCLGKGGYGCIDKLGLYEKVNITPEVIKITEPPK